MSEIIDLGQGRVARQQTSQRLGPLADKSIEIRHLADEVLALIPTMSFGFHNAIVGSPAQVVSGAATHSSFQAAHDAVADGDSILLLKGTVVGASPLPISVLEKNEASNSDAGLDGVSNLFGTLFPSSPTNYQYLSSIDIAVRNNGIVSVTALTKLTLWETDGDLPTIQIAESNSFLPAALPTTPGVRHTFTFPNTLLHPNKTYAFAIDFSDDFGGGNLVIGRQTPATLFSGKGTVNSTDDGVSWSTGGDIEFIDYQINGETLGGVTLSKKLFVQGLGNDSILSGAFFLGASASKSSFRDLKWDGLVALEGNQNFLEGWQSQGSELINAGVDNIFNVIEEF